MTLSKQEILGILNDHLYVDGTRVGGKVNAADALVQALIEYEREILAMLDKLPHQIASKVIENLIKPTVEKQ